MAATVRQCDLELEQSSVLTRLADVIRRLSHAARFGRRLHLLDVEIVYLFVEVGDVDEIVGRRHGVLDQAMAHHELLQAVDGDRVLSQGCPPGFVDNVLIMNQPHNRGEDSDAQGVRRCVEMMGADGRLTATAVQTVGVKGYDGFSLAIVG